MKGRADGCRRANRTEEEPAGRRVDTKHANRVHAGKNERNGDVWVGGGVTGKGGVEQLELHPD